jgi:hypothetical protein
MLEVEIASERDRVEEIAAERHLRTAFNSAVITTSQDFEFPQPNSLKHPLHCEKQKSKRTQSRLFLSALADYIRILVRTTLTTLRALTQYPSDNNNFGHRFAIKV